MAEDTAAEEATPKKSRKLVIIIAVVVLALLAGGGAAFFLLGSDDESAEAAEPVKLPAIYTPIRDPFIINYSYRERDRYMQVTLNTMTREPAIVEAMNLHMPSIRNRLISEFGKMDFEALQTDDGRVRLLATAKEVINSVLTEEKIDGSVEQVLFMNLVLQ